MLYKLKRRYLSKEMPKVFDYIFATFMEVSSSGVLDYIRLCPLFPLRTNCYVLNWLLLWAERVAVLGGSPPFLALRGS